MKLMCGLNRLHKWKKIMSYEINYNKEQFDSPLTHDSRFYTILRPFQVPA